MLQPIYIIGHQNPDVDAICSAIAYAELKKALGFTEHVPARCGNTNERINTVLDLFQVPLPQFIGDVIPRVHTIMEKPTHSILETATCAQGIELIDTEGLKALPVVTAEGTAIGIISIFQLGEFFLPTPRDIGRLHSVTTSIQAVVDSLRATTVCTFRSDCIETFQVIIASMNLESFGQLLHQPPNKTPQSSIVVVGNRLDIQKYAIEQSTRLLVLADGELLSPELQAYAREQSVSVISSPYDGATTVWIIHSALKLAPLINRKSLIFNTDDKLRNVRQRVTAASSQPLYMVVNTEGALVGVFGKEALLKPVETKLVLVDHNELSQAVPGAEDVTITEIIDHHRLGNPPTQYPIFFYNEPVGSTCTLVADLYRRYAKTPDKSTAGLMMAGIITDTLNLNSPTTTPKDAEILGWLETIAQMTKEALSGIIFSTGSLLLTLEADAVIRSDCKLYDEKQGRYAIAQVEEIGFDNFWLHNKSLQIALDTFYKQEHLLFAALLVTDIHTQNSLFVIKGNAEFIENIQYSSVEGHTVFEMPGIVSRKKQLIPYLTTILKAIESTA